VEARKSVEGGPEMVTGTDDLYFPRFCSVAS
jgi:hypothetical protein